MECNKEEAIRAKEIAEKRMTAGDFVGAHKIARKAQQIYPGLDNVAQLLTVCEVHCSAHNKIPSTEMDWYSILQIDPKVDEVTIKKQYKKLALLLHPDKNKFLGAEAAFKLIGEANEVLSDTTKRSVYDLKFRGQVKNFAPKPQAQPSQRNTSKKQQASASARPSQNADTTTLFWTCCGNCTLRFQINRSLINQMIRCPSCTHTFPAYDLGYAGAPSPVHSWTHLPKRNEGGGKAKLNGGKPGEFGTSRSSERKRKRKPDSERRYCKKRLVKAKCPP